MNTVWTLTHAPKISIHIKPELIIAKRRAEIFIDARDIGPGFMELLGATEELRTKGNYQEMWKQYISVTSPGVFREELRTSQGLWTNTSRNYYWDEVMRTAWAFSQVIWREYK